jgi:hypothetical protein
LLPTFDLESNYRFASNALDSAPRKPPVSSLRDSLEVSRNQLKLNC